MKRMDDKGYRQIQDDLVNGFDLTDNDKRVLRICRKLHIQSKIKHPTKSSYHIAKNYLNRKFHAEKPNQKWLTDVAEFKYYVGVKIRKVYLSAIHDLADCRIDSFVISNRNDNQLVFQTFDQALAAEPTAHPMFHSDRRFQYTSKLFCKKLKQAGMKQNMSHVAHCIDNSPMEGCWRTLKREKQYRRKFTNRESVVHMIKRDIDYYNNGRYQRCQKSM